MEFLQVLGRRRSIRFFQPYRQVEREKIQTMLEAARQASCAVNATYARAIVVNRDDLDPSELERLTTPVSATNFRLAPTYIFFYGDHSRPNINRAQTLKDLVEVGAMGPSHGWSIEAIERSVYPQVVKPVLEDPDRTLKILAYDTGVAATQALLTAFDLGLGASFAGFNGARVNKLLEVPEHWVPMYALLVGYPAESWEAGGQRPRPPMEEIAFERRYGQGFVPDPEVTEKLKEAGLLTTPAPVPWRKAELRALSKMLDLPE